jgi:NADPH2:quinone reductase
MRAVVITAHGGPEVLVFKDVAQPVPGPRDLLVRVEASGLNRADLLQRRGLYPAPPGAPTDIPGLELAGEVVLCGEHVTRFQTSDSVMGIVGGGACAEFALLHEEEAMPVPKGMGGTQAAAIPEAFLTAFDAAVLQGGLSAGQWLAINAVGSGVGTAAIQIAKAIGAHSVGSSRTQQKLNRALSLGLTHAICGDSEALAQSAQEATEKRGVSVVVDLVGGSGLSQLLHALQPQGCLIVVGLLGGAKAEISLGHLLQKRLQVRGTVLRSRSRDEKIALVQAFSDRLLSHFDAPSPSLRPIVDRVLSWEDVQAAHRVLEDNANFGKVVLSHR